MKIENFVLYQIYTYIANSDLVDHDCFFPSLDNARLEPSS